MYAEVVVIRIHSEWTKDRGRNIVSTFNLRNGCHLSCRFRDRSKHCENENPLVRVKSHCNTQKTQFYSTQALPHVHSPD